MVKFCETQQLYMFIYLDKHLISSHKRIVFHLADLQPPAPRLPSMTPPTSTSKFWRKFLKRQNYLAVPPPKSFSPLHTHLPFFEHVVPVRHCPKHYLHMWTHLILTQPTEMETIIIPILNTWELRTRNVVELAHGHTADQCQGQDSNSGNLTLESLLAASMLHGSEACISEAKLSSSFSLFQLHRGLTSPLAHSIPYCSQLLLVCVLHSLTSLRTETIHLSTL